METLKKKALFYLLYNIPQAYTPKLNEHELSLFNTLTIEYKLPSSSTTNIIFPLDVYDLEKLDPDCNLFQHSFTSHGIHYSMQFMLVADDIKDLTTRLKTISLSLPPEETQTKRCIVYLDSITSHIQYIIYRIYKNSHKITITESGPYIWN